MDIYTTTTDIIRRIWDDLIDRSGIGDELEQVDEATQFEIKTKWHELIADALIIHG